MDKSIAAHSADTPVLYPVKDAARLLGISRTTAYNLLRAGAIKAVVVGKHDRRIPHSEIERIAVEGARVPVAAE